MRQDLRHRDLLLWGGGAMHWLVSRFSRFETDRVAPETKRHPRGLIEPAGEAAVRLGITKSGWCCEARRVAGSVARLLGATLPGPLESAGPHRAHRRR
jgi:hypothetical protein